MKKIKCILIFFLFFTFVFPFSTYALTPLPEISGQYAITIDLETNEIIYTKNINTKAYPASITKLLTAILLAENLPKDDLMTYSRKAQNQEPSSYISKIHYIPVGETIDAKNAMDALLLKSCNDIAYMISQNVSNSSKDFAKLMNSKALKLNMKSSNFVTPNGLDTNIDNHYTTAYDLSQLLIAVYNNPWVKETINKKTSIVKTTNTPKVQIENSNKLLGIDGCIGGKTGFTTKAGRCLSVIYNRNGQLIGGIILKSQPDWSTDTRVFNDMKKIVNWSYNTEKETLINKNTIIDNVSAKYKLLPLVGSEKTIEVPIEIREDVQYYNNNIPVKKTINIDNLNPLKLNKNVPIGTLTITQRDYSNTYDLYPAVSSEDLFKQKFLAYVKNNKPILANN